MKYIEFLKQFDQFDKYILFLLSLGLFSVEEVADMTETTRQHVYNVIKRNKEVARRYMETLTDLESTKTQEGGDDAEQESNRV